MKLARCLVTNLGVLLGLSAPVAAHPIVIHAGTVRWTPQRLAIELVLDEHSLEHEIAALGTAVTGSQISVALAKSIQLIPHEGDNIMAGRITIGPRGGRVTSAFEVPGSVTTVALVHHPGDDLSPLARQIQLQVHPSGMASQRVIRLTTGGNHAVLHRGGHFKDEPPVDPFSEPVLRIATDDVERGMCVQIDYPCTLLALWPDLIVIRSGQITGPLFARSRPGIVRWANAQLSGTGPNGQSQPYNFERVDLLAPSGQIIADDVAGPFSVYTTRVRLQCRLRRASGDLATALSWTGFNAAVLAMPIVDERAAPARWIGALTASQVLVTIPHESPRDQCEAPGKPG